MSVEPTTHVLHTPPADGPLDPKPLFAWLRFFALAAALAYAVVALTSAVTAAAYHQLFDIPMNAATAIDAVTLWSTWTAIGLFYVSAFLTLRVLYRLASNLEKSGIREDPSPGWAVGCWFLPVANFFVPMLVVRQLWSNIFPDSTRPSKGAAVIGWWWATWVAGGLLLWAARLMLNQHYDPATQPDLLRNMWAIMSSGYALRTAAAVLLLAVLGPLVRRERGGLDLSTFD